VILSLNHSNHWLHCS